MATSPYNNPMFGQSLAGLIDSFVGNPQQAAQAELMAAQALNENLTAQYRQAIGDTGLSGDLSSMMIRSLQAGPDYARVAPTIGDNALKYGTMGFGSPELTPAPGSLADTFIRNLITPPARGGGGGSSGSSPSRDLTQSEVSRVSKRITEAGFEGQDAVSVEARIMQEWNTGKYSSLEEAAAAILPQVSYTNTKVVDQNYAWEPETVDDGSGSWLGLADDTLLSNVFDMFRGPEMGPELSLPPLEQETPQQGPASGLPEGETEESVLEQARKAIRDGKDPEGVREALRGYGIDPGKL